VRIGIVESTFNKPKNKDRDSSYIIAILLCFLYASPFGILLYVGKGRSYTFNLVCWIIMLACVVFIALTSGIAVASFGTSLILLIYIATYLITLVHGLMKITQKKRESQNEKQD